MTLHADDLHTEMPTEAIPVVPEDVDEYDDFLDDDFTQPRQRSRMTTALIALLLVALGFLSGVVVERSFGATNAPSRGTGGATTSSTARPPAGAGALGRL
jgi:hypothetical protein